MDLSSFHILKEDDNHYHVGHPNGRKLMVKKSELSPKALAKIAKMPKYAEGGEVAPEIPEYLKANDPIQTGRDAAAKYFMNDESALLQTPDNAEKIIEEAPLVGKIPAAASLDQSVGGTQTVQNIPQSNEIPTDNKPAMEIPQAGQPNAQAQQPGAGLPADMAGKYNPIEESLLKQKSALEQIGQAESQQGKEEAAQLQKLNANIDTMATQQDILNKNAAKDQALFDAFSSKQIDPMRYYKNLSTGQKVAQGIALVLGGIGAGLTGGPNQALNIIKDFVDKDIEAQKNDQSKSMNLWRMNREKLGNDLAANLATQNQLYTGVKYKLMEAASKANSVAAQARAQNGMAVIDQQIAMNRRKLSLMQQGMGVGTGQQGQFSGGDPSPLVNELVPPAQQQKAFEEIGTAQYISKTYKQILDAFDTAAKEQRFMSKPGLGTAINTLVPGVHSGSIDHLSTLLGPTFKQVEGTVRQAAMDNVFNHTFPQAFDNDKKIAEKRQALIDYLRSDDHYPVLKGNYIDPNKFQSTHVPDSEQLVRGADNFMYRKVQGGYERVK